jgi:hypothetical protein
MGGGDDLDLMAALGTPEEGEEMAEKKGGGSYLDGKDPMLVGHLMDAVDDSRSPEERAEALCRAMEMHKGGKMLEPDEMAPDADY